MIIYCICCVSAGAILESKGCMWFFKKKGKMYKIWKYFEKGQPDVCDCHMYETARICPEMIPY